MMTFKITTNMKTILFGISMAILTVIMIITCVGIEIGMRIFKMKLKEI